MVEKKVLIETVKHDWGGRIQAEICAEIIDYVVRTTPDKLTHITYGTLRNITDSKYSNQDLLSVIPYLHGDIMKIFEVKYEFYDHEMDRYFRLEKADVDRAIGEGSFVHPETGEEIEGFKSQISIDFDASHVSIEVSSS